jgi:hypothetical protein
MKRLLILLCVLLLCIAPVMGIRENFQNYTNGSLLSGGNPLLYDASTGTVLTFITIGKSSINRDPIPSTYFAWTKIGGATVTIHLLDSSYMQIYSYSTVVAGRFEVKVVGGVPYVYADNALKATGMVMAQNPSYLKLSSGDGGWYYDDIIIGDIDHHVVGALPSNWTVLRDFLNPAANGIYAGYNTTSLMPWVLKNSNYFYIDADTDSLDSATSEVFQISNVATGTVVNSTTIDSTVPRHQIRYYLSQWLDTSTVPDGQYAACFEGSSVCDYFWILSNGGQIVFDKPSYNLGDTGTMTWYLSTGYIDVSTYDYTYKLVDVYGNTLASGVTAVSNTDTTGTATITFSDSTYDPGVVYAEMIATGKTDDVEHMLGYSAITLVDYVQFNGYVNNAENSTVISGANINMTQGSRVASVTSGSTGNYTASGNFLTGTAILVNATAANFRQYTYTFTPAAAKTISLNISLVPSSPVTNGVGIGGVAREKVYGRPIEGATVYVNNNTYAETHTETTSMTGWYLCDAGSSCTLTPTRLYNIWGQKTGYNVSANYTQVAP